MSWRSPNLSKKERVLVLAVAIILAAVLFYLKLEYGVLKNFPAGR